jgi:propanol-preferring alcohol dehydrogenase
VKAVRIVETGKPLEMQEIDPPPLGSRDVRVRIRAAGICRSDVHYRAGVSPTGPLPLTPGHEVAGEVEETGPDVEGLKKGDRVCIHYLVTCGRCIHCFRGTEQFCVRGRMIGKHRDGGYAESIVVPDRSVFPLPDEVSFEHGAVLMCSAVTSLHAVEKSRLRPGESAAVFGVGGLGISAVQLCRAYGADPVLAVDVKPKKLAIAERYGAVPVDASKEDPVEAVRKATGGRGVDAAFELIGLPLTLRQAVRSLALFGRMLAVGITDKTFEVASYEELILKEAEIIGVSDHLASEIPPLLEWVRKGRLDLSEVVTDTVDLDADAINGVMDRLEAFGEDVRVVIRP